MEANGTDAETRAEEAAKVLREAEVKVQAALKAEAELEKRAEDARFEAEMKAKEAVMKADVAQEAKARKAMVLFQKIDANGNGSVSPEELALFCLDQGMEDSLVSVLFRNLDL